MEHERTRPEHPFFVIAMLGIDHFKRIELPPEAQSTEDIIGFQTMCREVIDRIMSEGAAPQVVRGPFGRPARFVCRFTYETSLVFDISADAFTEVRHAPPPEQRVTQTINNKPFPLRPL
ncbi:MAG: hypothetical protein ACKO9V_11450 [Candidatus Kapaibacterium sp.]